MVPVVAVKYPNATAVDRGNSCKCFAPGRFILLPLPFHFDFRGPLESSSVVAVEMQVGIGIGSAYGHDVRCTWAN